MKKFEYLIVDNNQDKNKSMNDLGKEGWELVSLLYLEITGKLVYYFKREI